MYMAVRHQRLKIITEYAKASGSADANAIAAAFARCLVPDDVQRWSDEVHRLIAESQRACPPLTEPSDTKRESERRKIEKQIAKLQAQLRELAANS